MAGRHPHLHRHQGNAGPLADIELCCARQTGVAASDAARLVARTAVQCHGAIGYTTEYELHLFAKRAWALSESWGGPDWHRDRLAHELGVPS